MHLVDLMKMILKRLSIHSLSKNFIVFHASEAIKAIEPMTTPNHREIRNKTLHILVGELVYFIYVVFYIHIIFQTIHSFQIGYFPNKTRHKSTIRLGLSEESD
ncbi:uncharacterized protein DS421_1g03890 [Arachis hypogaea]|nr:uncharacterized protein DS421_1g03890 [Arachis hypogaea]